MGFDLIISNLLYLVHILQELVVIDGNVIGIIPALTQTAVSYCRIIQQHYKETLLSKRLILEGGGNQGIP